MANYPTSDPSFANKSAGQTIASAHMNAVQDEIVAIGSALRAGLQHALTVSTGGLTVSTGNAVLGQNLSVAGNSTFVGPVTFSTFASIPVPLAKVTHSANQAIASGGFTGLSWDTEAADNAGMHSTSANSSRITFAHSTGWYLVGASVEWSANSSGSRILRLMVNDSSGVAAQCSPASGVIFPQSVSGLVRAASITDYVTVQAFQDSGSTGSVTNSTLYGTSFWAHKVSL